MVARRKVTEREYNQWVKWLRRQGYNGPTTGLKLSFPWVKQLHKELKKDPPTILETSPRDRRTILSNLDRYGKRKHSSQLIKGRREAPPGYELLETLPGFIDESKVLNRLSESSLMEIQGVPQYLYRLSQECHTPGLILCSREYLQRGVITWIECLGPCYLSTDQRPSVCMSWEQCLRQHQPTLHEHRLFVGSNRDNTVWMRLPSRFKYPNVEKMFPTLHDMGFYGEICKVEELGAIWLHRCEQLLSYLEHPDTESVTAAVENSAPGPTSQLPADVHEPALQALNAWDHQASAVRAWGELLKER